MKSHGVTTGMLADAGTATPTKEDVSLSDAALDVVRQESGPATLLPSSVPSSISSSTLFLVPLHFRPGCLFFFFAGIVPFLFFE